MAVVRMASSTSAANSGVANSVVQFGEIVSSERDLSPEDQDLLADIRRRKLQLIQEILMLRNEIAEVSCTVGAAWVKSVRRTIELESNLGKGEIDNMQI